MKFLVLVIITTWSFGGGYQNTPSIEIVSSPQAASIKVWKNERIANIQVADRNHYDYKLYEIGIEKKTIKEIEIPKLKFTSPVSEIVSNKCE